MRNDYSFSILKIGGAYQLIDSTHIAGFEERSGKILYLYDRMSDPELSVNLASDSAIAERYAKTIKAILQRFNNSTIQGELLVK